MGSFQRKVLLLTVVLLAGCDAAVRDRAIFFTSSNIGLNVGSQPPVAEIAVSRREGVVQPSFEGRQLPVAAMMVGENNFFGASPTRIGSVFAGGAAAVRITEPDSVPTLADAERAAELCVVDAQVVAGGEASAAAPRSFLFGTDTTIGLSIGWSAASATLPDSVRLGYLRRELAIAPIVPTDGGDCTTTDNRRGRMVRMPAFVATLRNHTPAGGSPADARFDLGVTIATGRAATNIAGFSAVRRAFRAAVQQETEASVSGGQIRTFAAPDDTTNCIETWLRTGTEEQRRQNEQVLRSWLLGRQSRLAIAPRAWLSDASSAAERSDFIQDIRIPCR